ncbi:triple tyrosine motif-containing protein [Lacibacter luteus]|nr:triple tyrosine motif-containing protein [Lacibacter luteus]
MLCAQNTIGIPNIVNYTKQQYNAGSQNWGVVQDKNGIMYWANNDGLLSFDGVFWRMYKLPNKTIARSVAVSDDNKIYVGGQGEVGYFSPGSSGELFYTSLNKLIPAKDNDFADVWNICFYQNRVFFRANKKILEYDGKKVLAYNSGNWGFLGSVNGELIANEIDKGLVYYSNGQWLPKIKTGKLPTDNLLLRSALSLTKDSTLLVSLMHGLFILHGDTVSAFTTPDIKEVASKNISSACMISADRIALATNLGGCIIINKQGKFIQRFTKNEGIQNNNVLSVMADKNKNLWFGLDNGIDLVTYSNAIRNIFPDQQNRNAGYTSTIFNNELYLGVSTGVYRIGLDKLFNDISYTIGTFEFVENSQGQVWNLSTVNDKLLMGHNKGAFIIEGSKALPLDVRSGFWSFQPLYATQPSSVIVGGTYNGISFANYNNGNISMPVVNSNVESARFVAIGKNIIWIAHPYKGLYKVSYDATGIGNSERYIDKNKILSSNHNKIYKLKNKIVLTTDNGIFEYDEQQKDFIRSVSLEKLLGKAPVSYLKEDASGNIWFSRDRKISVVDRSFKEPRIVLIPEIDGRIMANGFENILVIDSSNVLIAAEKGFFHINYALYKKNRLPLQALVRKVQLSNVQENGLIYGGYNLLSSIPSVKYKYNSLHFECSSTLFGQELNTEYSYYLEGFDKDWSVWTRKTERDYTNIPAGYYTFKVKCRNNPDNESKESVFVFKVLPPWYQTWWAYSLYAVLFFSLIYLFYKRQQNKYKRLQQLKLQEQQRKYAEEQKQLQLQHQLEIEQNEKQIIELRNEKLQSEVEHKNSELASSAMNLVQKKELLSKLKEDLVQYKAAPDQGKAGKEFQKILKLIDKELDHNEEWEQFAVHFDSVHTNYLKKLKEQYPSLTTSDLKLAAYLRLNLSSKEIAQLMNISIRGVETSRYRLRKKLDLANEMNLFDHLIKITT